MVGGRLSVRTSVPRVALLALGSALFVAAGAFLCWAGVSASLDLAGDARARPSGGASAFAFVVSILAGLLYFLPGLLSVAFFGPLSVFYLWRLIFFWRPALEVGPEGITDRASAVGAGFVRWEEVEGVRPITYRGQRFLAIRVKDEQALLGRQNPAKRLAMRLNRGRFTGTAVNVPLLMLATPEEELLAAIEPHLEGPARERLAKAREGAAASRRGIARGAAPPGGGGARPVPRVAKKAARWLAVAALSLVYYTTSGALVFVGGLLAWNGLAPGVGRDVGRAHPVGGAVLVMAGIAVFVFFPRLVKKLTGREFV